MPEAWEEGSKPLEGYVGRFFDQLEGGAELDTAGPWDFLYRFIPVDEIRKTEKGERRFEDVRTEPPSRRDMEFSVYSAYGEGNTLEIHVRNPLVSGEIQISEFGEFLEAHETCRKELLHLEIDLESYWENERDLEILQEVIDEIEEASGQKASEYIRDHRYITENTETVDQ